MSDRAGQKEWLSFNSTSVIFSSFFFLFLFSCRCSIWQALAHKEDSAARWKWSINTVGHLIGAVLTPKRRSRREGGLRGVISLLVPQVDAGLVKTSGTRKIKRRSFFSGSVSSGKDRVCTERGLSVSNLLSWVLKRSVPARNAWQVKYSSVN